MKLDVHGVEEILITDPKGVCNPPVPQPPMPAMVPGQGFPAGQTVLPSSGSWGKPFQPSPQLPTPFGPSRIQPIPETGDVAVPHRPSFYSRNEHDPDGLIARAKWGVGGPMIQQAAQQVDPSKWEKNWQAKTTGGEDKIDGNQYTS